MLKLRLFFGAVLIAALVGLVYADDRLSSVTAGDMPDFCMRLGIHRCDGLLITLVILTLVMLAAVELHRLFTAAGHNPLKAWPAMASAGLVLIPFLVANGPLADEVGRNAADNQCTVAWLTVSLMVTALLVASRRRIQGATGDFATTLLMIAYLGLLSQYLVRLRVCHAEGAAWLLLYVIGVVKFCDIGAYFTGRAIGRHKMIVWLSPNKTFEGLAGGILCSMAVAVLIPVAVRAWASGGSPVATMLPEPGTACVFGLLMALVGQAGDLLESLFKRSAQAKDSANAIPAFGGVLDVIDSPLLAAPIAYWMLV
ncbi:MAG: phosphatidate cytidylyltransferase [Planctomycetota bacterium]